jgi:inner membrane protein
MLAPTHLAFSILCTSAILQTVNPFILSVAGAVSLLPDIDETQSISGRFFYPISKQISKRFAHRTITHSWIAVLIIFVISSVIWIFAPMYGYGIFCGYIFGILGDMLTKNGVNFAYPAKVSVIIFRNPQLRFKTGSISEFILLIFIFFTTIGVFNLQTKGGFLRIYEQSVGKQSSAIQYFNNHFNEYIIKAKVEGFRVSDRLPINQQYRIIKVDGSVFVLQDNQGYIYRGGSGENVEILIDKIRVNKKARVEIKTKIITLEDEPILEKLNSLQAADEIYIFGSLKEVDDVNNLNYPVSDNYLWPIWVEGEKLAFYAARLEQLEVDNRYGTGQLTVIMVNY